MGMKGAATYLYRNLTKGCLSVKFRGRVIRHIHAEGLPLILTGATFHVLESGRQRTIREGKKYVHAFVKYYGTPEYFNSSQWEGWTLREVTYNPFKGPEFVFKANGHPASVGPREWVVVKDGKIFVLGC